MNEELKPCPFCGEPPQTWHELDATWVFCGNSDCVMHDDYSIGEWNFRPAEDALRARIDEMKRLLRRIYYGYNLSPETDLEVYEMAVESEAQP